MSTEIHHLAALSEDFQRTIRFYCGVLGLKYIKKALLFGGPQVGHFYWDERMNHFITFYHCPNLSNDNNRSQATDAISFSVDRKAIFHWERRLKHHAIKFRSQFDEENDCPVLAFHDPDGLIIKLVFTLGSNSGKLQGSSPQEVFGIRGFFSVELKMITDSKIKSVFTEHLHMKVEKETSMKLRLFSNVMAGSIIDFKEVRFPKINGYGRIHHVALKIHQWEHFVRIQKRCPLQNNRTVLKMHPNYYVSFYFWEDQGLMFELVGEMPPSVRTTSFSFKRYMPDRVIYDE